MTDIEKITYWEYKPFVDAWEKHTYKLINSHPKWTGDERMYRWNTNEIQGARGVTWCSDQFLVDCENSVERYIAWKKSL